jgi:two-component system CheB/CheR fusion protein
MTQVGRHSERSPAILVVEDQDVSRRALTVLLRSHGYVTAAAGSAEEALSMIGNEPCPAIALVDLELPGMSGLEFIGRMRQLHPDMFTVLLTAVDVDSVRAAFGGYAVVYMQKPVNFERLLGMLHSHQS